MAHPGIEGVEFIRQNCPIALPGSGDADGPATVKARENLCPYGCGVQNLDDQGYCHHLEGFTDGGQEKDKDGTLVTVYEKSRKVAGRWVTGEQKQEQEGDGGIQEYAINRILKPTDVVVHLNNGKHGKAFAGTQWARVYRPRKTGEVPVFRGGQTPDMGQLNKVLERQAAQLKQQEKVIARLAKEVGMTVDELDLDLETAGA